MDKKQLENLVKKYETSDFIKDDPIQFPRKFKNLADKELGGFIASLFAFGNRKAFIAKLDELFNLMNYNPLNFILNFNPKSLKGFNYRYVKDDDVIAVFQVLKHLYLIDNGLRVLFEKGYKKDKTIIGMLQFVVDYFYEHAPKKVEKGFYYLIPNPKKASAMKRMNMYLRWMVRDGEVDLGLWNFIPKSELIIPLDTHVASISRELGFLKSSSNNFKAALEITEKLKKYDKDDPIKYDFALFGYDIDKE